MDGRDLVRSVKLVGTVQGPRVAALRVAAA